MTAVSTHHRHTPLADDAAPAAGTPDSWRWRARGLLAELRDLLVTDSPASLDGWLAARGAGMLRERDMLLSRLGTIGAQLMQEPATGTVRTELRRLVVDVEHHLQRRRDLAWDEVELELGGSE
jgi:hypothetical protein